MRTTSPSYDQLTPQTCLACPTGTVPLRVPAVLETCVPPMVAVGLAVLAVALLMG